MNGIQAALLGILQGFTEFLPVSSSGHLIIARAFMDIQDIPVLFDVILHLATLVVVIWYFRRSIGDMLIALWNLLRQRNTASDRPFLMLALKIVFASVFTALTGLGISQFPLRDNLVLIAVFFLITAMILLFSLALSGTKNRLVIGWIQVAFIGIAQGFGVLPGISRSGITISGGLLAGLSRRAAGEFSFLISIPAIFGAFLLSLRDTAELSSSLSPFPIVLGFLTALLSGYISLRLLLWIVNGRKLWIFSIYLVSLSFWILMRFAV